MKITSFTLGIFMLLGTTLSAGNGQEAEAASHFTYDSQQVQEKFADLNVLEKLVNEHGITVAELNDSKYSDQLSGLNLKKDVAGALSPQWSIDQMDWGSFAWGFCCCWVGFFVVAINGSKTQDQKLSFWIGYGVNVVLSTISSVVYYVSLY